ncbi:uncharacterized protein Pp2C1 [Atheta coriaria]|uniref:uncharacterized protein Pp2C1 n=1 Tax=Dalotia coriaria TaxID=877792 RepID=UPI0031F34771
MEAASERRENPPGEATSTKRTSVGVNLRVTGHCQQGGRKYMEDYFAVAYQQTDDEKDLEYAFFGIFDGHGGAEAAAFAKEHLMEIIVKDQRFWCEDDADVLTAIKDGFIDAHHAMWKVHEKWPKTASGLPSTAGTTASIAFIRRGKIYVGHVGDSGITLGYQNPGCTDWQAKSLTKDHKPECEDELARIEQSGGKVIAKMGVPRVVWNRPRIGHKGPVRRSTPIDEIPFLAVARSLGDLWSYNPFNGEFVVSPKPDVSVHVIDTSTFRCLIFGTDGLYNMLSPQMAVHIVQEAERRNEEATLFSPNPHWINPSKTLVERALDRWCNTKMRADNTSVITLMLDPPGPPRAQVLRTQRLEREKARMNIMERCLKSIPRSVTPPVTPSIGIGNNTTTNTNTATTVGSNVNINSSKADDNDVDVDPPSRVMSKPRESTAFDPYTLVEPTNLTSNSHPALPSSSTCSPCTAQPKKEDENDIQINEITSSSFDNADADKKKKNIQRKFNLRSNNSPQAQAEKTEKSATSSGVAGSGSGNRRSPRDNDCSRLVAISSESRVLRERKNTTPNTNVTANIATDVKEKDKDKAFKKKGIKKKMALSTDKKRLLQNLLFSNKKNAVDVETPSSSASRVPKTKENNKTPPAKQQQQANNNNNNNNTASTQVMHEHITRSSVGRRSERQKNLGDAPREMRKSTLKLRMHEGICKAKLRAQSKIKLKRKAKCIPLKYYVGS